MASAIQEARNNEKKILDLKKSGKSIVEICEKLAIDTINKETNKAKCKKDLYEAIIQYF